jgi:arsenate reductase
MVEHIWQVLFVSSANSARSIMAEALLSHWGRARFRAFSAGYRPSGKVDPIALDLLGKLDLATGSLRSKSWDLFAGPEAPVLDFVFMLSDGGAELPVPQFPGNPMIAQWHLADPARVEGTEAQRIQAFRDAFRALEARIKPFVVLRPEALDRIVMRDRLDEIGRSEAVSG